MAIAIITAAGTGKRMNHTTNKILLSLADKPIIYWTIKAFDDCKSINDIVVVVNRGDKIEITNIIKKSNFKKVRTIVEGGERRQESVHNGLNAIDANDDDIILIHNGANPFVSEKLIEDVIKAADEFGAAGPANPARDTIKEVDKDNFVVKTLDRSKLRNMQTPQAIKYSVAKKAFQQAVKDGFYGTDDLALVERLGERVKIVKNEAENIKITYPLDLKFANLLKDSIRVGIGQDSHKFANEEKPLMMGGIKIENERGLEANSDGDVILHAIFNAIASSIGERSIGHYADDMCKKGIKDSKEYLKFILNILKEKEYIINNIGIALECKTPSISNIEDKIKGSLSRLLSINDNQIGITATSGEELTEFGKGNGIQCFVIVGVKRK